MTDEFDKKLRLWRESVELGTWREGLRRDFKPRLGEFDFSFQVGDGWRDLIRELMAEISGILGGPTGAPTLRVVQVKEELSELRCHVQNIPEAEAAAVHTAVTRAEERSVHICETCGKAGRLRQSHAGHRHTACDEPVWATIRAISSSAPAAASVFERLSLAASRCRPQKM